MGNFYPVMGFFYLGYGETKGYFYLWSVYNMGALSIVYGVGNWVCGIGDVSQQSASKQSLSRAVSFF
nr:hypothetical protein Q903MT_gene626 [Picea sitchensis]